MRAAAILLLWLTLWLTLSGLHRPAGLMQFDIDAQIANITHARLYFDIGNGVNVNDSVVTWIRPGHNELRFNLPGGTVRLVRLDFLTGESSVQVNSIAIGSNRQMRNTMVPLSNIRIDDQPGHLHLTDQALIVRSSAGNHIPHLVIELPQEITLEKASGTSLKAAVSAGALLLVLLGLWRGFGNRCPSAQSSVCLGIFAVFVLAWTMAWLSPAYGAIHPDEGAHVSSFQYYLDHLLPSPADDPSLVPSISIYGFSYLFELDVVYALAARTLGAFTGWFANETVAARSFNLTLLLLLGLLALRNRRWAIPIAVVLVSPQIWYVFSYFNADAFPLTLALIGACLVADKDSGLNGYLDGRQRLGIGALAFALVAGLLLISKRNYLPVVPIFGLWLAVRHLNFRMRYVLGIMFGLLLLGITVHLKSIPGWLDSTRTFILAGSGCILALGCVAIAIRGLWQEGYRSQLLRLIIVFGFVAAVATPRVGLDLALNGSPAQKTATLAEIAETHAGHGFKPSQINEDFVYFGRGLAQRGTTLAQVAFEPHHWLRHSLTSMYGVYGYFVAFSPYHLTILLISISLVLVVVAGASARMQSRDTFARMGILFLGGCVLVMANSLLHSWTFDMQPQGRYLFPIFALLSLLLGTADDRLPRRAVGVLMAAAFTLGGISFVGTALPALAEVR